MPLANVGVTDTRVIQMGAEGAEGGPFTPGVLAPATFILLGEGVPPEDGSEKQGVAQHTGNLTGHEQVIKPFERGLLALPDSGFNFEQSYHFLEASMESVAPVVDGAGTGQIRAYTMPQLTQQPIMTYSIEGGNLLDFRVMPHSFVDSWKMTSATDEPYMISSNWLGQFVTFDHTKTPALPVIEPDRLMSNRFTYFFDAFDGTVGTTQITGTVVSHTIDYTSGWKATPPRDSFLYFQDIKSVRPLMLITFVMEVNAASKIERDFARSELPVYRNIRLEALGEVTLTTPGDFTKNTMRLDVSGWWAIFDDGEADGDDLYTATFKVTNVVGSTLTEPCELTIVNEVA